MRFIQAHLVHWILIVIMSGAAWGQEESSTEAGPVVELAILLDTSSSMGGLIHQAQAHLWKIVNEFALAKQNGRSVSLKVGLYEYGKNTLPAADNFVRKILPLTDNLDQASKELFLLQANTISGGDEYCGTVIRCAVENLQWSPSHEDLKVIVIAGNEPFTQGPVDYRQACRQAIAKGILVNTIHCGPYSTGVSTGWKDGAVLADGVYCSIDQDRAVTYVPAPQDEELRRLGRELNETYIPYGDRGREGIALQEEQDKRAEEAGAESETQRAISKGSDLYKNPTWDLVDAVMEGKVSLQDLKKEDLPQGLRELSLKEQKDYIESKAKLRGEIQQKMEELHGERRKYLAGLTRDAAPAAGRTRGGQAAGLLPQPKAPDAPAEGPGKAVGGEKPAAEKERIVAEEKEKQVKGFKESPKADQAKTLDEAVIEALRRQAKKKGIELK